MKSPSPVKILITGFGPFPGVAVNPCQQILKDIRQARDAERWETGFPVRLELLELETVWKTAPEQLARTFLSFRPDIMIHLGYARQAAGFRLEQYARNRVEQHPDYGGDLPPSRRIIMGGPAKLATQADLPALVRRLHQAGLPAEISQDAGT